MALLTINRVLFPKNSKLLTGYYGMSHAFDCILIKRTSLPLRHHLHVKF